MTPKVCTLIFLRRNDSILLAMKKRGFGSNRYNGAGGKIEPGETVEQALIRETQEEIGVTPIHFWKVAEHNFYQKNEEETVWQMFVHVYICDKWTGGEPVETEEMAPEWFDIDKIPYDNMWSDDIHWLPHVLNGKKVMGEFSFDKNDQLVTNSVRIVEQLEHTIPDRV